MLSCVDVANRVTDYLERELAPVERMAFEEHVVICPPCRAHLTQMRATKSLLGSLPAGPLSPELEHGLLDAFRGWSECQ